ncbi:MAG TPA: YdcF family protein [Candidatus Saccharimonadales bacterium]|nr:YdcF family protein [Candidatus Saccharimonadales bacterium]
MDPAVLAAAPELIVVLGGGVTPEGTPGAATIARAKRAALTARASPDAPVILSGGREAALGSGPTEAEMMRDELIGAGVDPERLLIEDESRTTVGNGVLVAARYLRGLEPRSIHLISSPFHLQRAAEIFRHILGFAWQIQAVSADETQDDLDRAPNETRYLQEATSFFEGTKPGDLATIVKKLRADDPYYAGLQRLDKV